MRRWMGIAFATCTAATACVDGVPGAVRWTTEFEYFRIGGDSCEAPNDDGLCELRVTVRDDGTWSATGVPDAPDEGSIALGVATELAAVFDNGWRDLGGFPFQGVCATATGGEEYGYVVRRIPYGSGAEGVEPRVRESRSCWYDLERYENLVRRNQIETLWLAYKPAELDAIEFR